MTDNDRPHRLRPGDRLAPFTLDTLSHGSLRVPSGGLLHLQFRRFAGCPVCSLHLRSFARGRDQLEAAAVQTVAFFHSSAETMRPYHADLPFPVVPDPERRWYQRFGVERSALAGAHPKVVWSAIRGMVGAPSNPLDGEGGKDGLPADFLVGPDGAILAVRYGAHAADHWELEQVIALARANR
ncbi:peroxiredoxin-like family protein [Sorangium sp. So ce1335]|uniref:peroxiredoxin-like family protein n=1 Tax=Sorangium sp. So ce1335 TaxID=3133335 RepID=UPI003F5F3438